MLTDRPPRALHSSTSEVGPASHRLLVAYFRSGWAFLIPYLAAYLLYAWLKWPVNPVGGGQLAVSAIGALLSTVPLSTVTPSTAHSLLSTGVPCLLHVYWTLHALHLMLGLLALVRWWHQPAILYSDLRLPTKDSCRLWPVLPWVLLGLLFLLPGIYWEFPGDVWEHYTRINDYSVNATLRSVGGIWRKSGYFLPYSLVGSLPAITQHFWLNVYYSGMCLLLCWQYFQLAKVIGLRRGAAFVFVLLQALLLGNSIFSFYRYYGLSSTLPAQIGAVAFVSLVIRAMKGPSPVSMLHSQPGMLLISGGGVLLLFLMTFNHPQSLGFALLGLLAVILWRTGRRKLIWCGVGVTLASIILVLWWPVDPVIRDTYRSAGWISPWYGFNLLSLGSPAAQRGMQIVGLFGVVNLAAGAWLLRRKHLVGWLTVTPVLALLCPLFAIPFATLLSQTSLEYIVVFSRMLLGIPVGLALVACFQEMSPTPVYLNLRRCFAPFPVMLGTLAAFLTMPADFPYLNRFWQTLARTPADLTLQPIIRDFSRPELVSFKKSNTRHFVTTDAIGFSAHATGLRGVTFNDRLIHFPRLQSPATSADQRQNFLSSPLAHNSMIFIPTPMTLYSPCSLAGFLSGHWNTQEVALEYAAGPETSALSLRLGARPIAGTQGTYYFLDE